jgi:hypothetical protein
VNSRRAVFTCVWAVAVAWPAAAERLPADVTPLHHQLTVTPDFGTRTFDGDLTIDLQVHNATNRITLNAVDLEMDRSEMTLPYGRLLHPTITADAASLATVVTRLAARDADTKLLGLLQLLDARETIAGSGDPSFVTHALGEALKRPGMAVPEVPLGRAAAATHHGLRAAVRHHGGGRFL